MSSITQSLVDLEQKRKDGSINARAFYQGLLTIMAELCALLQEETEISDKDIRLQTPLILTMLKAQIKKLDARK